MRSPPSPPPNGATGRARRDAEAGAQATAEGGQAPPFTIGASGSETACEAGHGARDRTPVRTNRWTLRARIGRPERLVAACTRQRIPRFRSRDAPPATSIVSIASGWRHVHVTLVQLRHFMPQLCLKCVRAVGILSSCRGCIWRRFETDRRFRSVNFLKPSLLTSPINTV